MEHTLDERTEQQSALERAKAYGVDITLLLENLKYTPQERLERHQRVVAFLEEMRRAGCAHRKQKVGETSEVRSLSPEKLFENFDREGVAVVIVGGAAAVAHGLAYATLDLDVCYARDEANLERLVRALAPLHPRLRGAPAGLPFTLDVRALRHGLNFTLSTDTGYLDLFGEIPGVGGYTEVLANSEEMTIYGRPRPVITLEALIRAKRTAGRPKDLQVLSELETLLESKESINP